LQLAGNASQVRKKCITRATGGSPAAEGQFVGSSGGRDGLFEIATVYHHAGQPDSALVTYEQV